MNRRVIERFDKGTDLELHVSVVSVGDNSWVEVSDYVPSSDSYRRGFVLPKNLKATRLGLALRRAEVAKNVHERADN
jgi:hypothetical protein